MSKMNLLRRTRGVGDPVLPIIGGAAKLVAGKLGLAKLLGGAGKLLGIGGGMKAGTALMTRASMLPTLARSTGKMALGGAAIGGGMTAAEQLFSGVAGGGYGGGVRRRRGRGITAVELRGFNKVANLLRRVGMVPKATRRAVRRGR